MARTKGATRLSEDERRLIVLSRQQGKSLGEIAAYLGRSRTVVYNVVMAAGDAPQPVLPLVLPEARHEQA